MATSLHRRRAVKALAAIPAVVGSPLVLWPSPPAARAVADAAKAIPVSAASFCINLGRFPLTDPNHHDDSDTTSYSGWAWYPTNRSWIHFGGGHSASITGWTPMLQADRLEWSLPYAPATFRQMRTMVEISEEEAIRLGVGSGAWRGLLSHAGTDYKVLWDEREKKAYNGYVPPPGGVPLKYYKAKYLTLPGKFWDYRAMWSDANPGRDPRDAPRPWLVPTSRHTYNKLIWSGKINKVCLFTGNGGANFAPPLDRLTYEGNIGVYDPSLNDWVDTGKAASGFGACVEHPSGNFVFLSRRLWQVVDPATMTTLKAVNPRNAKYFHDGVAIDDFVQIDEDLVWPPGADNCFFVNKLAMVARVRTGPDTDWLPRFTAMRDVSRRAGTNELPRFGSRANANKHRWVWAKGRLVGGLHRGGLWSFAPTGETSGIWERHDLAFKGDPKDAPWTWGSSWCLGYDEANNRLIFLAETRDGVSTKSTFVVRLPFMSIPTDRSKTAPR